MKKLEDTKNQFKEFSDEFMNETKGMAYYEKYWEMLDEVQYQLDKMIVRRNKCQEKKSKSEKTDQSEK